MKQKLLLFVLILCPFSAFSQIDSSTYVKPVGKNYIGVNAGTTTGLGLSYIYWPEKHGIQLTFLPLLDKKHAYYSLGINYLRRIKEYPRSTFYLYVGNHLTNMFGSSEETRWHIGVGPGVEYFMYDFVFHFMIGYGVYNIPDNIMTRPSVEFGVFYKL